MPNLSRLNSDFEVVGSKDGIEAIEHAGREKLALVLPSVEMPRMDGRKTLMELPRRGCRIPVPKLTNVDNVPARVMWRATDAVELIASSAIPQTRVLRYGWTAPGSQFVCQPVPCKS